MCFLQGVISFIFHCRGVLPLARVLTRVFFWEVTMVTATMRIRSKRTVSVTLEPRLLERARAAGINLSATLTAALQREISGSEADRWKRENRAAMQELNSITEEHGLLSDDYRSF